MPHTSTRVIATLLGSTALMLAAALAAMPARAAAAPAVDFDRQIKPILAKRCFNCHGPDKKEGGLRLSERKTALAELDSGLLAIVPGKSAESELLRRVAAEDEFERMPPEGKPLTAEQIALLRRWIDEGATWPKHWAFQPLVRPEVPQVKRQDWVRSPIDAFILHRLEAAGLAPAEPAGKVALLRRAYHDLIGLPPSPEQVQAFLADDSPDAYERVIDELLRSEHYGERWARHWLDVVRFAETNSFERDGVKPQAWRYRDWVIRSLNDDMPYDQFVREQLAGDELDEVTVDSMIATGFYRLGLWDDEPADRKQARADELDDIVTVTSQGFLGLTVNCARCHDHKIDPIPQKDYYRLVAFFENITPYGPNTILRPVGELQKSDPQAFEREVQRLRAKMEPIEQAALPHLEGVEQDDFQHEENRLRILEAKVGKGLSRRQLDRYKNLVKQLDELRNGKLVALCVSERGTKAPETFVLTRGNPHVQGDTVVPGYPSIIEDSLPEIPQPDGGDKTTGRRRVLAEWITAEGNPLSSRVIANRVWQHHFGRGIVRSPNNFGLLGVPPTHPKLLDWLATELVADGWRLKSLHKKIMLSSAYRMSSRPSDKALAADPSNDLWARFDMRRMDAEEIRDSILAVTGTLNTGMYGPGIYPEISAEVLAGQSVPGKGWGKSSPEEQARRSVYIHVKRSLVPPELTNFDFPETDASCEARFVTTQPAQALAMLNGKFLNDQAAHLAERLGKDAGDDPTAQVRRALWLTTCREPSEAEIGRGVALIERLKTKHKLSPEKALTYYCLVALNQNEFLNLD